MLTFRRVAVVAICGGSWLGVTGAGCGGSSEVKDSGPDTIVMMMDSTVVDRGPDVMDAGCMTDADLNNLNFGDAGWPADSGFDGGGPQVCWNCLKTKCMSLVQMCNMDCACRKAVGDTLTCISMGGMLQSCAGPLLNFDPQFALQFGACALGMCNGPCPIPQIPDSGGDGSGG